MKKIAGIDIGTNSVLYSLFAVRGKRILEELYFERHSPRIGHNLAGQSKPEITDSDYRKLKKIIAANIRHAEEESADEILIAATNPLRLAANGREVKNRLESDIGYPVAILSSNHEAFLSFLAAAGRLNEDQTAVVIDMGGGSTELVVYRGEKRMAFVSLPEGAVSLTERFDSQKKINTDNFADFEKYLTRYNKKTYVIREYLDNPIKLVGGTSTALAYIKNKNILRKPNGVILTRGEIGKCVNLLAAMTLAERRQLLNIDKKRAEIIFAGAFWYKHLFNILGIGKAVATPRGLRHGLVLDFLSR